MCYRCARRWRTTRDDDTTRRKDTRIIVQQSGCTRGMLCTGEGNKRTGVFLPFQFRCYRFRPSPPITLFVVWLFSNIFSFCFIASLSVIARDTYTMKFTLTVIGLCTRDKYKCSSSYNVVHGGITENYGRLSVGVCQATFRLRLIVYVPLKSKFYCIKRLQRSNMYDFSVRSSGTTI